MESLHPRGKRAAYAIVHPHNKTIDNNIEKTAKRACVLLKAHTKNRLLKTKDKRNKAILLMVSDPKGSKFVICVFGI